MMESIVSGHSSRIVLGRFGARKRRSQKRLRGALRLGECLLSPMEQL
jgi:hypothetical protein